MIIFLRQVPEDTVKSEVMEFLRPVLKSRIFQRKGDVEQVNILALKDTQTNQSEFHVLVSIEPDNVGKRIIKQLNNKIFKGKHITVREYTHRSWHNDRRTNLYDRNEKLIENRKDSRRRPTLDEIEGHSVFFNNEIY